MRPFPARLASFDDHQPTTSFGGGGVEAGEEPRNRPTVTAWPQHYLYLPPPSSYFTRYMTKPRPRLRPVLLLLVCGMATTAGLLKFRRRLVTKRGLGKAKNGKRQIAPCPTKHGSLSPISVSQYLERVDKRLPPLVRYQDLSAVRAVHLWRWVTTDDKRVVRWME